MLALYAAGFLALNNWLRYPADVRKIDEIAISDFTGRSRTTSCSAKGSGLAEAKGLCDEAVAARWCQVRDLAPSADRRFAPITVFYRRARAGGARRYPR